MPCAYSHYWYPVLFLVLLDCSSTYGISTTEFGADFERTSLRPSVEHEESIEGSGLFKPLVAPEHHGNGSFNNESSTTVRKKVDKLGEILKKKVEMLQMHGNSKVRTYKFVKT